MPSVSSDAPLLDPKNDYVFKRLFAQRIDLLTDLVNLVRGGAEALQLTEVLNPTSFPKTSPASRLFWMSAPLILEAAALT